MNKSYGVYLYDMEIEDVKERFAKRQLFIKASMAANFLGIEPNKLYNIMGDRNRYAYHRETRKKYAVRKVEKI